MAHHYEDMKASAERRQNAKHEPDVYGFEGESLVELYRAIGQAIGSGDPAMLIRLGRKEDGSAEAWAHVKAGKKSVGAYNESFTCPPRPPEDCED